jgi:hypothetical protein
MAALLAASPVLAAAPAPDLELAADSGVYLLFRNAAAVTDANLSGITGEYTLLTARGQVRNALELDALDLTAVAGLSGGADGPVAASLGIVDAAAVTRLAATDSPPVGKPFAVRFLVVVPIADPVGAAAAVDRLLRSSPVCARAATGPASACASGPAAVKATIDANHRQLRWAVALGTGDVAAAVAAPFPLAPLADRERLQRDALGSGQATALYATPDGEVHAFTAVALVPLVATAASLQGDVRGQIWRQAVHETGGLGVLAASKPRLFSSVLFTDQDQSWDLTPEGDALFASLALPPAADAKMLEQRLADKMKHAVDPKGPFANRKQLTELVSNAGQQSWVLLMHFFWPHGFALVRGEVPGAAGGKARVQVDRPHHKLIIRRPGA